MFEDVERVRIQQKVILKVEGNTGKATSKSNVNAENRNDESV